MCFDRAYGPAACVALTSLFLNSPNTEFEVDLLQLDADPKLDDALKKLAVTFNRDIRQHYVDQKLLTNFHASNHITQTAYLRFFIPEYVNATRVLYLDCDLIVQCDVDKLFSINLAPGALIAGVEDLSGSSYAKAVLGISDTYINSGVLLLDPTQWKKHRVTDQLISYYSANANKVTWHDQCVINGALTNKKQALDFRFNLLANDLQNKTLLCDNFSENHFDGIFHFNSTVKPWHLWCYAPYKALWDRYASVAPCVPDTVSTPRNLNEWQLLADNHERRGEYQEANHIYRQLLKHNQSANLLEAHRTACSQRISNFHTNIVQHGLMKGMHLSESGWGQADKGAMILGLYEQEVSSAIASIDPQYNVLVDVGAADGYYGVGLLVNNRFSESFCFEASDDGRRILAKNALVNHVSDRVHIFGKADRDFYKAIPEEVLDRSVVVVDIEGQEFELLNTATFTVFQNSILIVELHDWFFNNADECRNNLLNAASKTHTATFITTGSRNLSAFEELSSWSDTDRWLICSEGRGRLMTWVRFDPINKIQ